MSSALFNDAVRRLRDMEVEERNVTGYMPLPNKLDELCGHVANAYARASESERAAIRAAGSPDLMQNFVTYASRMAVVAVRERDEDRIFRGLVGLCIEDCSWDERETLLRLSLLYHSARKLGLDAAKTFNKAAAVATPRTGQVLRRFGAAPASIASMGYSEGVATDGLFDYDRNW
jgi:hypothetical protein